MCCCIALGCLEEKNNNAAIFIYIFLLYIFIHIKYAGMWQLRLVITALGCWLLREFFRSTASEITSVTQCTCCGHFCSVWEFLRAFTKELKQLLENQLVHRQKINHQIL